MSRPLVPVALLALLLTALPAAGQVYSWKDKDGRTHYGDMPPAAVESTLIRGGEPSPAQAPRPIGESGATADMPARPPGSSTRSLAEREQAFRERRAAAAEAEAKAAEEAETVRDTERFCASARHELAALRDGQRMMRFNAQGKREFLDDQARAEQAARLERQIAEHCR
jgi:hypothetical protein